MTTVPEARRTRAPGWRDPRILLGLALVAGCVLVGAWLMSRSDDSVGVLVAGRDLAAGTSPTPDDLEVRRLRFADADLADRYLAAGTRLPDGAVLDRTVGAGDLLPRDAVVPGERQHGVEVPLSVLADDVPATVEQGAVVDVWVVPGDGSTGGTALNGGSGPGGAAGAGAEARRVLDDVTVVRVPPVRTELAPDASRQVIVGLPSSAGLERTLGTIAGGRVVLTRQQ